MILRVQSPEGTKRVECETGDTAAVLYNKIQSAFNLPDLLCFTVYKNREKSSPVPLQNTRLSTHGFKHGDMLYLVPMNQAAQVNAANVGNGTLERNASPSPAAPAPVAEDEVDVFMSKQSGLIDRPRDDKLCHHGANAKCVHCTPLEPYDENYMREHSIKHLSFHSYLRKITGGLDKGKFAGLENISCKLRAGCRDHAPWPRGICTKCQPNALTLNRQVYRHVDMVMFENPTIVEHFLDFWRETMHQRIGFLYGRYEAHKDVPLGIRATVAAIYEPPQESTPDAVKLLPDEKEQLVDELASRLGLVRVGWIFTDLVPEDLQKGTVKHLRNIESCFLSAQECIMAGHFQNSHPNPCRLSPDGYFGSKFVTVCVTGDSENRVHMEGYQVSNQCMALVRDNCLVPTRDAPELGYVRESSNAQYVPDVFYKYTDSYGNEVTQMARPLPIEYLLVDVPVSTPKDPKEPTFYAAPGQAALPRREPAPRGSHPGSGRRGQAPVPVHRQQRRQRKRPRGLLRLPPAPLSRLAGHCTTKGDHGAPFRCHSHEEPGHGPTVDNKRPLANVRADPYRYRLGTQRGGLGCVMDVSTLHLPEHQERQHVRNMRPATIEKQQRCRLRCVCLDSLLSCSF
ncbi:hypothetical protein MTO96_023838 [Rhipicephalus appendiculatus]